MYHVFREKIDNVWFFVVLNDDKRLVSCSFSPKGYAKAISKLLDPLPPGSEIGEKDVDDYASNLLHRLHQLYEGKKIKRQFPLSFENTSVFNRKALEATMMIPRGYVSSYGEIAKKLGRRRASRAVGRAEARNPFPLVIPCHRVIRSTLALGEYGGGQEVKRRLLEREGVRFSGDRVSRDSFWTFPP